MSRRAFRVAVAVSGKSRSLSNLIKAKLTHGYAYEIAGVIASAPGTGGESIAAERLLPLYIGDFSRKGVVATKPSLLAWLQQHEIGWIALAGFLKLFPDLPPFHDRVINIHPSLLPRYGGRGMYGMNVHKAVFTNRELVSGPTIHFVNEDYDQGKVVVQHQISLLGCVDAQEVADRVFASECALYPRVLHQLISEGIESFNLGHTQ